MSFIYKTMIVVLTPLLLFLYHTRIEPGEAAHAVADSAYKDFKAGRLHPQAPPETAHMGQLAGVWQATQTARNRDGSWSDKQTKADWIWYYILDGHAIQDD